MSGVVVHACNPSAEEAGTGGSWGQWPLNLAYLASSRPVIDPVSKKLDSVPKPDTQDCPPAYTHTHTLTCTHTCKHSIMFPPINKKEEEEIHNHIFK